MICLFKCRCGSFRWVPLPDTTAMHAPVCHGIMRCAWVFLVPTDPPKGKK